MATSEIARFRRQQAMQEEAARQGLYGLAVVASHEAISVRMEQTAPYLLQLMQEGKLEQVDEEIGRMQKDLRGACRTTIDQQRNWLMDVSRSKQQEEGKNMDEHAQQHTLDSERAATFPEDYHRKQLSHLSVGTILARLTKAQAQCILLQEELYTRAELQDITMQEWERARLHMRGLLDCLQELRTGEPVQEGVLQRCTQFMNVFQRYFDDTLSR